MKSMTGYGKAMVAGDDFSVSVDLKTVNNRFLDIHLRVGSELASLESSIKNAFLHDCHGAASTLPSAWSVCRKSPTRSIGR
jgi:uncharacterized protein YicC (UPF0701 family)